MQSSFGMCNRLCLMASMGVKEKTPASQPDAHPLLIPQLGSYAGCDSIANRRVIRARSPVAGLKSQGQVARLNHQRRACLDVFLGDKSSPSTQTDMANKIRNRKSPGTTRVHGAFLMMASHARTGRVLRLHRPDTASAARGCARADIA